jgi:hypothetical protein
MFFCELVAQTHHATTVSGYSLEPPGDASGVRGAIRDSKAADIGSKDRQTIGNVALTDQSKVVMIDWRQQPGSG